MIQAMLSGVKQFMLVMVTAVSGLVVEAKNALMLIILECGQSILI